MKPADYASRKMTALEIATAAPAPFAETRATAAPQPPAAAPDTPAAQSPTAHRPSRSTGPKTAAGKKRSSQNSFKHGLSGRTVVMPGEDMALYLKHSKEIVESLNPVPGIESELAQTVADGFWRMKRLRTVEESMFAWGTTRTPAISTPLTNSSTPP